MCNRYRPADKSAIEAQWQIKPPIDPWAASIGPWQQGPFIRLVAGKPEMVVGQWALIGDADTKANSKPRMTNNARFETIEQRATFRGPWQRRQRCVIPATSYDEPNWESEKNVWWSLRRRDRQIWHLAGIWNAWTDPVTGEILESYTMITTDARHHPLLRRLHKPERDSKTGEVLPMHLQDKRAVIPLEWEDVPTWLRGSDDEARELVQLPAPDVYDAGPVDRALQPELPGLEQV